MIAPGPYRALVLGVHPTARGFGFAVFEAPFSVFDAGQIEVKRRAGKNARCIRKFEKLLERLRPETLVLEAFDTKNSARTPRIRRLCLALVELASDLGLELAVYTRADVHKAFETVGAKTRDEIAEAVLRQFPALNMHYPGRRKPWEGEDRRQAIFSAAALVLTHYRFGASSVFERLMDAA